MSESFKIRGLKPHKPVSAEEWHRCRNIILDAWSKMDDEEMPNLRVLADKHGFEVELAQWIFMREVVKDGRAS